jgi:hypothetical protein
MHNGALESITAIVVMMPPFSLTTGQASMHFHQLRLLSHSGHESIRRKQDQSGL